MSFTHDWRIGDRVSSIAVRESVAKTGLGTIQKIILDKALIVWDDGYQSEEYLKHLILAGFDESKVLSAEFTGNITDSLNPLQERTAVNAILLSGLPLTLTNTGVLWG